MNIPSVIMLIVVAFFPAILPISGHALTPGQVFDRVKDAVVVVKTLDTKGQVKAQGSGVLISSGRVATNCHFIKDGTFYQVGRGEQFVSASLYVEDVEKDICLLDAKGIEGKPAQLGKAADLKVGDPVYAVGAPKGLELSLPTVLWRSSGAVRLPSFRPRLPSLPVRAAGAVRWRRAACRPDNSLCGRRAEPQFRHARGVDRRG